MLNNQSRDYRPWLIVPLGLALGMTTIFVPNLVAKGSLSVAGDYGRYYTAAHFLLQGHNPYNQLSLLRAEQTYRTLSIRHALATSDGFVLLPFVLWPLIPLAELPFWASYALLVLIAILSFAYAMGTLARALQWSFWWLVPLFGCAGWIFVWGRLVGQLDFLIPISLLATCGLIARERYYLAGVALSGVWVEPELSWIAGMALLVVMLNDGPHLKRTFIGFLVVSVILFGVAALAPKGILLDWFQGGTVFVHREATHEFDLLGLPGLIQVLSPKSYKLYSVTSIPTIGMAALGTVAAIWSGVWLTRSRVIASLPKVEGMLWKVFLPTGIWLLVTPYGHPNNAIVLIPLVVLVIGPNASHIAKSKLDVTLLSVVIIVTQYFSGTVLFDDLMPIATAVLLVMAYRQLRKLGRGDPDPPLMSPISMRLELRSEERSA